MDTRKRIKKVLSDVQDALFMLRQIRGVEGAEYQVSRALSGLNDAESNLRKVLKELPD